MKVDTLDMTYELDEKEQKQKMEKVMNINVGKLGQTLFE